MKFRASGLALALACAMTSFAQDSGVHELKCAYNLDKDNAVDYNQTHHSTLKADNQSGDAKHSYVVETEGSDAFSEWPIAIDSDGRLTQFARAYAKAHCVVKQDGNVTWDKPQSYQGSMVQFLLKDNSTLVKSDSFIAQKDSDFLAQEIVWDRFLPAKTVSVGESWSGPDWIFETLFRLQRQKAELTRVECNVSLKSIANDVAVLEINASADGKLKDQTDIQVACSLKASLKFNLKTRAIDAVEHESRFSMKNAPDTTPPVNYEFAQTGKRVKQ